MLRFSREERITRSGDGRKRDAGSQAIDVIAALDEAAVSAPRG